MIVSQKRFEYTCSWLFKSNWGQSEHSGLRPDVRAVLCIN